MAVTRGGVEGWLLSVMRLSEGFSVQDRGADRAFPRGGVTRSFFVANSSTEQMYGRTAIHAVTQLSTVFTLQSSGWLQPSCHGTTLARVALVACH